MIRWLIGPKADRDRRSSLGQIHGFLRVLAFRANGSATPAALAPASDALDRLLARKVL